MLPRHLLFGLLLIMHQTSASSGSAQRSGPQNPGAGLPISPPRPSTRHRVPPSINATINDTDIDVETDKFYADTNNNMVDASSDDDDNDNEKEKEMNIGKRIRRDNADIAESGKLYVLKRDGHAQEIHYDKIQSRLQSLSPDPTLDIARLTQKVITGVYPGVKTSELDTLAAETAAYLSLERQEYGTLASRISISNLHKSTSAR